MKYSSSSANATFEFGRKLSKTLNAGDVVLLHGGLGAGKTLLTKGILAGLSYDVDEVTSPSFTLVNLYKTEKFDVYHIDLWRLDGAADPAMGVGLDEILEQPNSVVIIEWADRLRKPLMHSNTIKIEIVGDGDQPRSITTNTGEAAWQKEA